jgi:hypothetical protein
LREIIPGLHLLGIFAASDNPLTARDVVEVQEASRTLSLETIALKFNEHRTFLPLSKRSRGVRKHCTSHPIPSFSRT